MARKVVGVGSVGTRAFIGLLQGRDEADPLFLQVKEATQVGPRRPPPEEPLRQPGERVVQGQRLMQAASDIFLGWTKGCEPDRYLYWRQLRDMKGSAEVEAMIPAGLTFYGQICGRTLARAHARSGDPVAIAAYLGRKDHFERQSPTSPNGTPTRTSGTTRRSSRRSGTAGWPPSKACESQARHAGQRRGCRSVGQRRPAALADLHYERARQLQDVGGWFGD